MKKLDRINQKLSLLKRRDGGHIVFGASKHQYRTGMIYRDVELECFENKYKIQLPEGYRDFLKLIGAGGAGPCYGLELLTDGVYADLDYKSKTDLIDPSKEFMFTEAWNLKFDAEDDENIDFAQQDDEYFDPKWANGLLRICNFGCGVSINLVVQGKEHGNIWVDDRCNDGGIYPDHYFGNNERINFLEWYELWLDKSLSEVGFEPEVVRGKITPTNNSWWKRLFGSRS